MARIGFMGIGLMGAPMARRLLDAGHDLRVWSRSPDKLEGLVSAGAIASPTPRALAAGCDLVALCLTDAAAVEQVLFGSDGAAGPGLKLVDFTSMSPAQSRVIAARLREVGGEAYVDAPVSGGVAGASAGSLVVMCGGEPDHVKLFDPLFDAVASRVTWLGPVGAGQTAKLCNQHLVSASIIAMAEAVALARRHGLAVERLPAALEGGFADSKAFQLWGTRMANGAWDPNVGAVDTMWKDTRNLLAAMQAVALDLPLLQRVENIYAGLSAAGRGKDDLGSIVSYFDMP